MRAFLSRAGFIGIGYLGVTHGLGFVTLQQTGPQPPVISLTSSFTPQPPVVALSVSDFSGQPSVINLTVITAIQPPVIGLTVGLPS